MVYKFVFLWILLTFYKSVDFGQPADDIVSAISLPDVNVCREQAIGRLRVDQRYTHSGLKRERVKKKTTQTHNIIKLTKCTAFFLVILLCKECPSTIEQVKTKTFKEMGGKRWGKKQPSKQQRDQIFTSDLNTQNGFPGQQSSFILSSASDANKTSICSNCLRGKYEKIH